MSVLGIWCQLSNEWLTMVLGGIRPNEGQALNNLQRFWRDQISAESPKPASGGDLPPYLFLVEGGLSV